MSLEWLSASSSAGEVLETDEYLIRLSSYEAEAAPQLQVSRRSTEQQPESAQGCSDYRSSYPPARLAHMGSKDKNEAGHNSPGAFGSPTSLLTQPFELLRCMRSVDRNAHEPPGSLQMTAFERYDSSGALANDILCGKVRSSNCNRQVADMVHNHWLALS